MSLNEYRPINDAPVYMPSAASTAYGPGDLLWDNGGTATPASAQVDQLSEADNQIEFAQNFVGICGSQKLSTDSGTGEVEAIVQGEYRFTAVSGTFNVGDLLGADEAASGTALEDQQVKAVTDPRAAIAIVVQDEASATTKVWGRLLSKVERTFYSLYNPVGFQVTAQTIDMSDAAVTLTKLAGTPTGTYLKGNLLLVDPNSGQASENLLLPPEADMTNELLVIKNTGGEHIALQNDAGGAVATIEDAEFAIVHCDGSSWTAIQAVETT